MAVVSKAAIDADADTDILARILADTSDRLDFLKLFLWQLGLKLNDTPTFSRRSSRGCRRVVVGVRVGVVECEL